MVMGFKDFVKNPEGLVQKICCATQGYMNLLESLLQSSFLVKHLKTTMMFIQNRLLCVEHQIIDGRHVHLPVMSHAAHGNRLYTWTTIIRTGGSEMGLQFCVPSVQHGV
jgi:hypothetical protein